MPGKPDPDPDPDLNSKQGPKPTFNSLPLFLPLPLNLLLSLHPHPKAGRFLPFTGSASESDCTMCEEGAYTSDTGATECVGPCPAGSFVTNVEGDPDGVGVTAGGTHCVECPAGRIAEVAGSSACISCPVGTTSTPGSTTCVDCQTGTYSDQAGTAPCKECRSGEFADSTGSVTCTACDPGTYSNSNSGVDACTACDPGTSSKLGAGECDACVVGKFAEGYGSEYCEDCPKNHDSEEGSDACYQDCPRSTYYDNTEERCVSCPTIDGVPIAVCPGGNYLPIPKRGYWLDYGAEEELAAYLYKCPTEQRCGKVDDIDDFQRLGDEEKACWTRGELDRIREATTRVHMPTHAAYNHHKTTPNRSLCHQPDLPPTHGAPGYENRSACAEDDSLICLGESKGILCTECVDENSVYYYSRDTCVDCSDPTNTAAIVVMVMTVAVLVVLMSFGDIFKTVGGLCGHGWCCEVFFKSVDLTNIKIVWSTLQIIASVPWVLGIEFPEVRWVLNIRWVGPILSR